MTGAGRPFRFLCLVIGGWVALRVVMLWPTMPPDREPITVTPRIMIAARPVPRQAPLPPMLPSTPSRQVMTALTTRSAPIPGSAIPSLTHQRRATLAMLGLIRFGPADRSPATASAARPQSPLYPPLLSTGAPSINRWSASGWVLVRGGAGLGTSGYGGQLGGGQAGLRLAYAIDARRRLAIATRFVTPLSGNGREAAIGLEWQPTRLPIRLIAEQRIAIDGAGGGPSIGIVGGAGPAPIGGRFRIEGYAQAGFMGRDSGIGFGDGAVRINRPVKAIGPAVVDLGAGAWGGIQPGARRLDIGPSLGLSFPVGAKPVRVSLDWRERIGGEARPESGLALTIGHDF